MTSYNKNCFNKLKLVTICLSLISYPVAFAEDKAVEDFVWSFDTIRMIESADPKRGEAIAKEQKCAKCHGDTGISDEDDSPSIAGQIAAYTYKQLIDYKTKVRDEKTMFKKVRKLGLQDFADMSAFYALQEPEPSLAKGENPPDLVTIGDKKRLLIACNICHGKNGEGYGYESPALTGQKIESFVETMMAFREEDRENDHYSRMRFISSQLTEEEIEELAAFYAAKPLEDE